MSALHPASNRLTQGLMALAIGTLVLAGCAKGGSSAVAGDPAKGESSEDPHVPCALAGAKTFTPACLLEKQQRGDADFWIVRHPDGGFRRFQLIDNGTRIATADGMQEVEAERAGANLEVRVGTDRYLFPAAPEPVASESHVGSR